MVVHHILIILVLDEINDGGNEKSECDYHEHYREQTQGLSTSLEREDQRLIASFFSERKAVHRNREADFF